MHITNIDLGAKYASYKQMCEALANRGYNPQQLISRYPNSWFRSVDRFSLSSIDGKVKNLETLSFEEAFAGMCFVLAGTNNFLRELLFDSMPYEEAIAKGSAFLQLMAMKEVYVQLEAAEIAGLVAACYLDVVYTPCYVEQVVETSGMGGDRGWTADKSLKTINVSTLSSIVAAASGTMAMKHGSFGNTTRVGSTDIPLNFGANIITDSRQDIDRLLRSVGFWYNDAHAVKTVHYLSHLLMVETVNHVVGPMTPPVGPDTILYKVMGVNHHVMPATVVKAYNLLHELGVVNVGGVIVVSGLDTDQGISITPEWLNQHIMLDELSPRASVAAIGAGSEYFGTLILDDTSFDSIPLNEYELRIPNNIPDLMQANERALTGIDMTLARYLARNAALTFLAQDLSPSITAESIRPYHQKALDLVLSGAAYETLCRYVEASGGRIKKWID